MADRPTRTLTCAEALAAADRRACVHLALRWARKAAPVLAEVRDVTAADGWADAIEVWLAGDGDGPLRAAVSAIYSDRYTLLRTGQYDPLEELVGGPSGADAARACDAFSVVAAALDACWRAARGKGGVADAAARAAVALAGYDADARATIWEEILGAVWPDATAQQVQIGAGLAAGWAGTPAGLRAAARHLETPPR